MKKLFTPEHFSTLFFNVAILFFIIGFGFTDTPTPFGWYQQFMPNNLPNFQVSDIFFLDSLTGWAVTGNSNPNDTSGYILKTTNEGDNWILKFTDIRDFSRIKFINANTGFVSGGYYNGAKLYKTTDGGENWFTLYSPLLIAFDDMSVLNNDTIWVVDHFSGEGGVFYTSNGGVSWQHQLNIGSNNPDRIYMYNARIGFVSGSAQLRKTTNSGQTWTLLNGTGTGAFSDIFFIDSLTGWKAKDVGGGGWLMGKTTDGGFNWIEEILPSGGYISSGAGIEKFTNINSDTIWGAGIGAYIYYPTQRAFLYRTTNGGDSWYMQIPDTSFQIFNLSFVKFINKLNGWSYRIVQKGIHTVTGGDSVFYLPVKKISSNLPDYFKLFQNYPNPFNPVTTIKYQIKANVKRETSNLPDGKAGIQIKLYDISGKLVTNLVNENQRQGEYEVTFDGSNYSSGVYFYSLFADGVLIDTKKMILLK